MNYIFKNITIRTDLRPGDLGYVIYLHGSMYGQEYQYGISFETYVAKGMYEFYAQYDPDKDRVWICEDGGKIIGFLLGMHRSEEIAQLRFFILLPGYRGMGLGKKLMEFFMEYLREKKFRSCYLWTTNQQATAAFIYKKLGFELTKEKSSNAFGMELMEQRYDLHLV
jgi:ribosomal protein S18 acetylase RimI-like enzyme